MQLGDVLAGLTDDSMATEAVLGLGDLTLLAAIRAQAEAGGLDLATYVTQTVRRYASEASDEEWITMMGLLSRAHDPGATFLQRVFESVSER